MTLSDRIRNSKSGLKDSQKLNVTAELYNCYDELQRRKNDYAFLMTVPVNIVSANESFFKELFSSLLNFDQKFIENSKKIIQKNGVKIDIEDIFHITKSSFTLGDLISYYLKYSSIESLLRTFKEISEIDLLDNLEGLQEPLLEYHFEYIITSDRPIIRDRVIKNLKDAYEARNIICHDFLSSTHKLKLDFNSVSEYLLDAILLQHALDLICSDQIYSRKIPLEDDERIKCFQGILNSKLLELSKMYNQIESSLKTDEERKNFKQNIEIYDRYLENDSKNIGRFWFKPFETDFLFEDLELEYKIKLIDQRIANLTET